jgi:DNA-binding NtrC family response regulator
LDAAPAASGLRRVLCHFKEINESPPTAVTEQPPQVRLASMGDTGGHAAPARVLVVDDEPSIRLLCRVNLELAGYEVLEADSLATVREALAEEEVDVVVLDVHLRGERSDVLVAECHALTPPIPVVLVTGSVDITNPSVSDADAVLPKPFELDEFLTAVADMRR